MSAERVSRPGPGATFQTVVSLFVAAVLLVGGGVALYSAVSPALLAASYERAAPCASVAQALSGAACRYTGLAQVFAVGLDNSVSFRLQGVADRTFVARFPNSTNNYVDPGVTAPSVVPVELWSGSVTRLADVQTADNPEQAGNWGDRMTIGGVCTIVGLALIVWAVRRRGDDTDRAARDPGMAPVAVADTIFNR